MFEAADIYEADGQDPQGQIRNGVVVDAYYGALTFDRGKKSPLEVFSS